MESILQRFLKYVSFDTASDEDSGLHPSSSKQKDLGRYLFSELTDIGASDVFFDEEHNYVYAKIPANDDSREYKKIGFIAHMDTSPEISGANVNPQVISDYDGSDIKLGNSGFVLSLDKNPELSNYIGKTLITTDGTTLLGSDDKAGIAEIMTMADILLEDIKSGKNLYKHGQISIAFTPDEEIGEGILYFDMEKFDSEVAYTVDGGALGELEYENFNAASLKLVFNGVNVHPGDAKDKMVNALKMAIDYNSRLPVQMVPEKTEGYEGFFHLCSIDGNSDRAESSYIIRNHDLVKFEEMKTLALKITDEMNSEYKDGSVEITLKDQYFNMRSIIENGYKYLVDNASLAMTKNGVEPVIKPIRGGTDGAMLSFKGLPCPNLCTGGHNFHGRFEYCCLESMEKIVNILVDLVCL